MRSFVICVGLCAVARVHSTDSSLEDDSLLQVRQDVSEHAEGHGVIDKKAVELMQDGHHCCEIPFDRRSQCCRSVKSQCMGNGALMLKADDEAEGMPGGNFCNQRENQCQREPLCPPSLPVVAAASGGGGGGDRSPQLYERKLFEIVDRQFEDLFALLREDSGVLCTFADSGRGTDQTSYVLQPHLRNYNVHCKVHKQWLSTPVELCDTNPCKNGGTCVQGGSASAFTCTCSRGYAGEACEVDACAVGSIANVETGTFKGGGDAPSDVCPVGTEPISSFCECKAAALALGKTFKGETSPVDYTNGIGPIPDHATHGCSVRQNHPEYTGVWFNAELAPKFPARNMVGQTAPVCQEFPRRNL